MTLDDGSMAPTEVPVLEERVRGILARAQSMGEDGDYQGMAEYLRDSLSDDPDDPWLLCWLGVAERTLGLEGVAYERFKQALAMNPRDPILLAMAGTGLADFADPEAEATLRTATILGPEEPAARWRYGAFLTREGFVDRGVEELVAAARLDPEDPVIAYELGVAWALSGKTDAAVDAFARAVERAPEDGWIRAMLGLAMVESDRAEEAVHEFEVAADLRPDDPIVQTLVALTRTVAGDADGALEYLERARFHADGPDVRLVDEAEERIDEGAGPASDFMRTTLVPSTFRERLGDRP